jgi:electron transport complex protein RnfC
LETVVEVGVMVREALGARHVWLALDQGERELVARAERATHRTPMRVIGLPAKYPQGNALLLVYAVLGLETPCGGGPASVGACVLDVRTLPALASATVRGEPATHPVVTVTGTPIVRAGNYRVPVGMALGDVLNRVGLDGTLERVVDGGPLTGQAVGSLEAVVSKATTAIVAFGRGESPMLRPGPCVHCGWCQEDCPVGLDPQAILAAVEVGRPGELAGLHPEGCLACGLCSYVCPARLPLADGVRRARDRLARVASNRSSREQAEAHAAHDHS